MIPSFSLAGSILSRNHGLATFVHERLEWSLVDQSPEQSETEWLCVDVAGYKIVNVYKPPHLRLTPTTIPTFPHPSLYIVNFNCQHVNWGYNTTFLDSENLDSWATSNNLGLLYNPKETASFFSRCWNIGTNPDLAFTSLGQDSRLPDRRVLGKFPWTQHRPFLITPPRFKVPAHSNPVKRWNFRKADWKRFCLLTGESVKRLPPPDTPDIQRAYQDFCGSLLSTTKQCIPRGHRKNYAPCWDKECETLYRSFIRAPVGLPLTELPRPYSLDYNRSRSDGRKLSTPSTSRTPAARRGESSTNLLEGLDAPACAPYWQIPLPRNW